jgi:hypothetical protein
MTVEDDEGINTIRGLLAGLAGGLLLWALLVAVTLA